MRYDATEAARTGADMTLAGDGAVTILPDAPDACRGAAATTDGADACRDEAGGLTPASAGQKLTLFERMTFVASVAGSSPCAPARCMKCGLRDDSAPSASPGFLEVFAWLELGCGMTLVYGFESCLSATLYT